MFSQVGVPELLIVLFIVLLLFGTKRLPALGRQLGGGLREFKDAITGEERGEAPTAATEERLELPEGTSRPAASGERPPAELGADRRD
jgi:sec-independent protein translocase protein TatA